MDELAKETYVKAIIELLESIDPKNIRRIYDYVYRWSKRSNKGA
ncbi:hypothetical protein [Enterococcus ureilyticus]|nr:hypothetical protein [Enterococcus ureilyticus]MBM7690206.1 hypothetical protein [Enterococcus ureilyticus]